MGNFIKIDRKILEWEWYRNEHTKNVFLHCLLKANWKEGKFEGKVIPRGSFVTSVKKLSAELDLTEDEVKTALKHLIKTGELTKQTTNKYTVITVSNYGLYQEVTNQIPNNSQTDTQELQNDSTSITKPLPTIEEEKEDKEQEEIKKGRREENNSNTPLIPQGGKSVGNKNTKMEKRKEPIAYYPNDEKLNQAFIDFVEMRKKIKKPLTTDRAVARAMNKLQKLSGGDNELAIQILEQSIFHCWQDVYELKEDNNSSFSGKGNADQTKQSQYEKLMEQIRRDEEDDS